MGTRNNEAEISHDAGKRNRNFRFFHSEAAAEATGDSASNYSAAFLVAAGAGSSSIALVTALTYAVSALLFVRIPDVIRRVGSTKKVMLGLACLDALGWLPVIALLLLSSEFNLYLFIALWVINIVPGRLIECTKSYWLIDLGPGDNMARYMSVRSIIRTASYIVTFFVMAYLLQVYRTDGYIGFIVIFSMAFAAAAAAGAIYGRIRGSREKFLLEYDPNDRFSFIKCLKELGRGTLGKFILFATLLNFAVFLSSPYFQPYMLRELHYSYPVFAAVLASEFIAKIAVVRFWGKYADRAGRFRVLVITSLMIPFIPIFWLLSASPGYLVGIQFFSGIAWAGFDLCSNLYVYESAPRGERLKYLSYHKAMTTFGMAMGALGGVYLLDIVRPLLGSQILSLFLLSGVLRLAAVGFGLYKMGQVHWSGLMHHHDKTHTAFVPAPVVRQVNSSRPTLYYRQAEWQKLRASLRTDRVAPTSQSGLYYRHQEWERYLPAQLPAPRQETYLTTAGAGTGLYQRSTRAPGMSGTGAGLYHRSIGATATLSPSRARPVSMPSAATTLYSTVCLPRSPDLAHRFSLS